MPAVAAKWQQLLPCKSGCIAFTHHGRLRKCCVSFHWFTLHAVSAASVPSRVCCVDTMCSLELVPAVSRVTGCQVVRH
jgi:hypothetical protein